MKSQEVAKFMVVVEPDEGHKPKHIGQTISKINKVVSIFTSAAGVLTSSHNILLPVILWGK